MPGATGYIWNLFALANRIMAMQKMVRVEPITKETFLSRMSFVAAIAELVGLLWSSSK